MKNTVMILLMVAMAGLAGIAVWQRGEINALRDQAKGAEIVRPAGASDRRTTPVPVRTVEATRPAPAKASESVTRAATASVGPARTHDKESTNRAARSRSPMAGMAKMLKSPGMKDMIRAQSRTSMDLTHGALFKSLGLSAEEQETFKNLLIDKQMALMDASMDMMDGSLSAEQRKEKMQEVTRLTGEFDDQIKTFLGEEDFAVYKQFEDTQPERMQVNMFKQALPSAEPLDAQQEHELIRAMYEERTNFPFSVRFDRPENADPSMFTESSITNHMAQMAQLQDRYLARAGGILSSNQFDQFKRSQDQMRSMQEMGMKMATQMFGGRDGEAEEGGDGK